MSKTQNAIRTICEIGLFAALGFVIDELQGIFGKSIFVNGGAIGFAMIVVIIIGLRRGMIPAILTGLAIGLFDFATGAYIIHPVQPILDYIIPYAMVGLALIFRPLYIKAKTKKEKYLSLILLVTLGGLFKLVSHYLAGVIFWADQSGFAWNLTYMNPYLYSLVYNLAYIGPTIILSSVIMILIENKFSNLLQSQIADVKDDKKKIDMSTVMISGTIATSGAFVFVYYLIDFIKSFEQYDYGSSFEFETNGDSMLIFLIGLFMIVLGVFTFIKSRKNKINNYKTIQILSILILVVVIHGLARLFRMNMKSKSEDLYRSWVFISFTLFLFVLSFSELIRWREKRKENDIISAN